MKKIIFIFFLIFTSKVQSIIYPIEPKYASLKKDRVYLRWNASFEAPIKFIYQKKNLPILIIDKYDVWKKVRDIDGDEGWIHKSMISNKKTFINKKEQNLFKYKDNNEIIIAIIKEGVVGKIISCENILCKVKIKPYKGWVEKKYLWGMKKD